MSRQDQIRDLISTNFDVTTLDVVNESHMHSVPPNSETHFKVTLVSQDFEGKSKVARHQSVYALLGSMMQEGLHALALHLYTSQEWAEVEDKSVLASPNCMGGSK